MKLLDSKIFDCLNCCLAFVQNRLDNIRQNSFILSNIDIFILVSIFATLIISTFASTEIIGVISALVPVFVIIKVLMTKGEKIEIERCNFYLLLYLLICLISNFTSSMLPQSLYGFMKTLIYFAFYFAMCQFLKNKKNFVLPILAVIAILISVECVIALFQNSIGVQNISTWQDTSYVNPEDVLTRVYGTLKPYNPNLFAAYLIAGFPAVLAFLQYALKTARLNQLFFL